MDTTPQLIIRATLWRDHDPDPATRAHMSRLIEAVSHGSKPALAQLEQSMAGPLQFGTAGLRGAIGCGESRMNRAVVIRTTAGLVSWLKQHATRTPRIVVGCDGRHGSVDFAQAAARVASAAGAQVLMLPLINPTPLTAFSVRYLDADAGVMVTASHNPPQDNGYKVYLGGTVATGDAAGVQIISPADSEIAAEIAAQPFADDIAQNTHGIERVDTRDAYVNAIEQMVARLVPDARGDQRLADIDQAGADKTGAPNLARAANPAQASANADVPATVAQRAKLSIALTAMHGVGADLAVRSLRAVGFTNISLVPAQVVPDPNFPTVPFPNPEEPGAMDLASAHASKVGADLLIALDPDADRCALAIPDAAHENGWRQLSGDQTGSLLGEFVAAHAPAGAVLANSIVSGRWLGEIARAHGLRYVNTLTGFKWIARTPGLYFGYEEAIGTCPDPAHVRDKDGISTAVVAAVLFAQVKAAGRTGVEQLDDVARRYGLYQTAPLTFRVDDPALISRGMARLRNNPPIALAGAQVSEVADLAEGYQGLPPTDGVLVATQRGDRVVVRPSGTEPKLKCYLEVVFPPSPHQPVPYTEATERLEAIKAELRAILGF